MTKHLRLAIFAVFVSSAHAADLKLVHDEPKGVLNVYREGGSEPILTQNARADFRPYMHPIVAPDGKGVLTEYSPGHHKHQTGLYWGFTRVNGRDYFHHPEGSYWKRQSVTVIEGEGHHVSWQTVYDLLDEGGQALLTETQTWTMHDHGDRYDLDLEWSGKAHTEVTIGKYDYGGLFLRMPWKEGIKGEVVNAARQRGAKAEGQRAMWVDVSMQVDGREDLAHIAIFDHSDNAGFPQPWRVDGQLGVGPVRARLGDWEIASGETETIKHRVVVYTGELDDVSLTKQWGDYSDQGGTYALWGLAQREGREAEFLTPDRAVAAMTTKEGYQVNAFAHEPMITQPMAFCWDDRGRMWIAENRDYESRGHGFSAGGDSRILILEDTDHDGVADSRKVFLEGIPFPAAIAVGFDGLWLGAPPNLLFVPDRNGDDKADMDDIEVRLTGWGIRDRHETLNSFHWGPDGWLYGCQGFATPSKVRKPTDKGRLYEHNEPFPEDLLKGDGVDINGGVFRYHPIKDRFEVVAHGFSNPWGIDFDAKGQIIISACVIPHLWHVIPGGIYHRQGGSHFNPYVYQDIRTIVDHRHRSAHGGARVYLSDAFPEDQHGLVFMANIHEHAVLTDRLVAKGSGFVAKHGDDFMLANNAQWIGFSVEIGPEGGVYVLDWHDGDICGKDVLHKESGRVYRITPKASLAKDWDGRYGNLAAMSDKHLVELQRSESAWHARRARVILQHRAVKDALDAGTQGSLREIFEKDANPDWRLRALWALHVTGGLSESEGLAALQDVDPHIRAWSIQLLCEDKTPPSDALPVFASMAKTEASAIVRLYLAAALQRVDEVSAWSIAEGLVSHGEDEDDHNIPKMIWFGLEPLVAARPAKGLDLASRSHLSLVRENIARRAADANALTALLGAIDKGGSTEVQRGLLKGMLDGLEGRNDLQAPAEWASIYADLERHADDGVRRYALDLAQLFGDAAAERQLLDVLGNPSASVEDRQQALSGLVAQQSDQLKARLPVLLDEEALRRDAIRAVAAYEDVSLAREVLKRYEKLNTAERADAVQAMAARSASGWELTQALKRGDVPKRDIPAYVARQLRRVVGNGFVEVWGPIDQLSADKEAAVNRYKALLTDEAVAQSNPNQGRQVFDRTCAACHKMYGEGGEIGPDITGSNRANLDYLLSNILDPTGEIQDAYKMVMITTRDGRTYAGNVASESERQVTLRVVGQEPAVIAKSSIQSREVVPVSMMPEGLLGTLTDAEVLNLVAYMRTTEQVPAE